MRTKPEWCARFLLVLALVAGILPGVAPARAATLCAPLGAEYKATITATYSNAYGVPGDAVNITGSGTATAKGVSTLSGEGGTFNGELTGTASMTWSETSNGRTFGESASGPIPDPQASSSYAVLDVDPSTCDFSLSLVVSQRTTNLSGDPATRQTIRMHAKGSFNPSGVTSGSATMPNGLCSPTFGGSACYYSAPPTYYPTGSASGSLTYKIEPPGPVVNLTSAFAQHQPDGQAPWVLVDEGGTREGWPLRIGVRFDTDRPLAAKLHVKEVTAGGYERTADSWTTTTAGDQGWGGVMNLPPIPGTTGEVDRSLQVSLLYCPTASPCSGAALKETPARIVHITIQPPLSIEEVYFQTRSGPKAPWVTVTNGGVWRGDEVRILLEVRNTAATGIAFGLRISKSQEAAPFYSDFWRVAPRGTSLFQARINPAPRTGVKKVEAVARLDFCPGAVACAASARRFTSSTTGSYTESAPLRVVPQSVAYRILDIDGLIRIPDGATRVKTGAAESSPIVLTTRVLNEGPARYHRLVLRETTPGEHTTVSLRWRVSGSGANGLDYKIPIPGAIQRSFLRGFRSFDVVAQVCPSSSYCSSAEMREIRKSITIEVQPLVGSQVTEIYWGSGGAADTVKVPESGAVRVPVGASEPLVFRHRITIRDMTARYQLLVRDLDDPAVTPSTNWFLGEASKLGDDGKDTRVIMIPGNPGNRTTTRRIETWLRYCPGSGACTPERMITLKPQRLVISVR